TATPVVTPTPEVTTTATPVPTPTSSTSSSYITIDFDKTEAEVGDTVKATVRINKISKISGYQINLKYDPNVLQPIKPSGASYTNSTIPSSGTIITNDNFAPINAVSHKLSEGILNFCKLYMKLEEYRLSEEYEDTGTIAVIEFKLLKDDQTAITFENTYLMPNAINGTMIFDADGNRITSGYSVVQPEKIN
ncbi:MAG: cohesin, partial [Clostridiaceae bacterium]|nr:cohesin [Clostridiaceae bacterium]